MKRPLLALFGLAAAVALFTLVLNAPLAGQTPQIYQDDFAMTPEFDQALTLLGRGAFDEARAAFTQIAAQNPHTTIGAFALLKRIEIEWRANQLDTARASCQELISSYPLSRFEVAARDCLIDLNSDRLDPTTLNARDLLVQSYGGPSLNEILKNRQSAVAKVAALPTEVHAGVEVVYQRIHTELRGNRTADAMQVALFNRQSFPSSSSSEQFATDVVYDLVILRFGNWAAYTPADPINPSVSIISPRPDHSTGPRPKIRFETTCGDWREEQLDLSKLTFTLDGTDMSPFIHVQAHYDERLRNGHVFERLRFTARPSTPLTQGPHTVAVSAQIASYQAPGPGLGQVSWSFTVARGQDDPGDEQNDSPEDSPSTED